MDTSTSLFKENNSTNNRVPFGNNMYCSTILRKFYKLLFTNLIPELQSLENRPKVSRHSEFLTEILIFCKVSSYTTMRVSRLYAFSRNTIRADSLTVFTRDLLAFSKHKTTI